MDSKSNPLLIELNEQLQFLDVEINDKIKRCEKPTVVIIKALKKLKNIY